MEYSRIYDNVWYCQYLGVETKKNVYNTYIKWKQAKDFMVVQVQDLDVIVVIRGETDFLPWGFDEELNMLKEMNDKLNHGHTTFKLTRSFCK